MMDPDSSRTCLGFSAALLGFAAVLLGALGSHAVTFDSPADSATWRTALDFHLFHVAVMLAVTTLAARAQSAVLSRVGLLFGLGTLLFSGSLYLRAAGLDFLPTWLAPCGGLVLMAAWGWLALILVKKGST